MWVYYGILIKTNAVINQSTLNSKAKPNNSPPAPLSAAFMAFWIPQIKLVRIHVLFLRY